MKENNTVEAEIVEDEFKAPILRDIKYPVAESDLIALVQKYKDIQDINLDEEDEIVAAQYKVVRDGHIELSKKRNEIEKTRKAIKDPAFTFGKNVDAFAKKLQSIIADTETKLKFQRDRVEQNEERKQREAEEKEEARTDAIKGKIKAFEMLPLVYINSSSEEILTMLNDSVDPTEEAFEEFYNEAVSSYVAACTQLRKMYDEKVLAENSQRLQDEKDEEARRLKEIEDRKHKEEREKFLKEQADFQRQQDDFNRQQREQQEVIDRQKAEIAANELQKQQEAERVERDRLEEIARVEREAFEQKELAKRKREDAKHREAKIAETLKVMDKYTDNGLMLNEIIAGAIPNLKWEV